MTPQKRRMHLIDKHMYPKNYFFALTKEGIDGRRSLLTESGHHRRRSSNNFGATKDSRRRASILEASSSQVQDGGKGKEAQSKPLPETRCDQEDEAESADVDMEELTGAMSSLQFIPSSVRFGRGGRAGFAKR
jgi:hypothetical protein